MQAGDPITSIETLVARVYAACNHRDIDTALAYMNESVSWPRASEGGRVIGKQEIRAYWTRQWQEFDPHVDPIEVIVHDHGHAEVKVHQLVRSRAGELLSDSIVGHRYTIVDGLIERMDLLESEANSAPSAAFSTH